MKYKFEDILLGNKSELLKQANQAPMKPVMPNKPKPVVGSKPNPTVGGISTNPKFNWFGMGGGLFNVGYNPTGQTFVPTQQERTSLEENYFDPRVNPVRNQLSVTGNVGGTGTVSGNKATPQNVASLDSVEEVRRKDPLLRDMQMYGWGTSAPYARFDSAGNPYYIGKDTTHYTSNGKPMSMYQANINRAMYNGSIIPPKDPKVRERMQREYAKRLGVDYRGDRTGTPLAPGENYEQHANKFFNNWWNGLNEQERKGALTPGFKWQGMYGSEYADWQKQKIQEQARQRPIPLHKQQLVNTQNIQNRNPRSLERSGINSTDAYMAGMDPRGNQQLVEARDNAIRRVNDDILYAKNMQTLRDRKAEERRNLELSNANFGWSKAMGAQEWTDSKTGKTYQLTPEQWRTFSQEKKDWYTKQLRQRQREQREQQIVSPEHSIASSSDTSATVPPAKAETTVAPSTSVPEDNPWASTEYEDNDPLKTFVKTNSANIMSILFPQRARDIVKEYF